MSDLFDHALQADEEAASDAITVLNWRGSREVLERAVALTRSDDPVHRERGVEILGQLGNPERTFPAERFAAIFPLLADNVTGVVRSAVLALRHVDADQAAPHIVSFAGHEDAAVRHAVAMSLGGVDQPEAEAALLALMRDRDADVRNWATFGIGQQGDADSDKIREALATALQDDDSDVRYEAVIGLGRRRDRRAVGFLKTMLHENPDDIFALEAAEALLGLDDDQENGAVELLGALQRLQRWGGTG